MAVGPVGLKRVVADRLDALQDERLGAVALRCAAVHAAEEVGLAGTDRTRTCAAEILQRIV